VKVGIVVGLAAEARMTKGLGGIVAVGGGTREGAQEAAEELVRMGVGALLSFGYAGGLDPELRPGDLLVPSWVYAAGKYWTADPSLGASLGGLREQVIFGAMGVVGEVAAKQRVYEQTHASAVDMESGAVAQVADRNRLPFAVLRAICDPADRALPPLAMTALNRKGQVRKLRLLGALLRRPWQIPGLMALGRDAAAARATLVAHVKQTGRLS
jgi:adenosylhomocysteine nucleosidase